MNPVYQLRNGRLVNCTNRARKLERDRIPFFMLATFIVFSFAMGFYSAWSILR
jgi:hypothetical protein